MEETLVLRIYQDIVGIIGILGNVLVCFVIFKVRSMQTRTNAFIFHQAVIDLLGSILIVLRSEIPVPEIIPSDGLGWFLCHVWHINCLQFYIFLESTSSLLVLTMERYYAIVHPFKYQAAFATRPKLKVGVCMAVSWVLAFIPIVYCLFNFEAKNGKCVPVAIRGSTIIGTLVVVMQYVIPVAVMLFAYIRISVEMKRGAARVGPAPAQHLPGGANAPDMAESLLRARRNTFKMLLIVFITFSICWTPNQIIFLLFNLGFDIPLSGWFYYLSVAMVASNSCVNPMIYAFKYRQFRNGLRQIFCRQRNQANDMSTISTGTG
ncbi:somatostatin receptor type 5-like [Asterias rubens]|uniref:somatostatin receptor type 5-like n=1 Tax=Asterias rubens TaxID=7604 RepID=UPI0014555A2A|nr:somatostatin receptor type 5-like [Asterias rubens]